MRQSCSYSSPSHSSPQPPNSRSRASLWRKWVRGPKGTGQLVAVVPAPGECFSQHSRGRKAVAGLPRQACGWRGLARSSLGADGVSPGTPPFAHALQIFPPSHCRNLPRACSQSVSPYKISIYAFFHAVIDSKTIYMSQFSNSKTGMCHIVSSHHL